jgi:HPt (histidine-containing phosphotransfer) domain-containing protein
VDEDEEYRRFAAGAFREDSPALVQAVHNALASRDRPAVTRAAHALKGVLMHLRAERGVEAARALEVAATYIDADLSDLEALASDLEREVTALSRQLEQDAAPLRPVGQT